MSAVLLAEGVTLEPALIETAEQKGINVLRSGDSAFRLAALLGPAV